MTPTQAETTGVASVIHGDMLEIHGQPIRLHGIDSPESSQTCLDETGKKWRCGEQAALALQDFIGGRTVRATSATSTATGGSSAALSAASMSMGGS